MPPQARMTKARTSTTIFVLFIAIAFQETNPNDQASPASGRHCPHHLPFACTQTVPLHIGPAPLASFQCLLITHALIYPSLPGRTTEKPVSRPTIRPPDRPADERVRTSPRTRFKLKTPCSERPRKTQRGTKRLSGTLESPRFVFSCFFVFFCGHFLPSFHLACSVRERGKPAFLCQDGPIDRSSQEASPGIVGQQLPGNGNTRM